jgi:exopolyphosphatase/guanosine-5'-triphosphate,3'-diphosphate pyrophosphatase
MIGRKDKPLAFEKLKELYTLLKDLDIDDRMEIFGLNPDRADVIVPAAKIYLSTMKAAGISEMLVPQIGLSDGIVHQLHYQYKTSKVA